MTLQTKAEKAKNRGLRAAQNPAKFFHFSSVKVHMLLKIVNRVLINMPYSYFLSLKTIFFKIRVTCTFM